MTGAPIVTCALVAAQSGKEALREARESSHRG
jgi:hypothetical protein